MIRFAVLLLLFTTSAVAQQQPEISDPMAANDNAGQPYAVKYGEMTPS